MGIFPSDETVKLIQAAEHWHSNEVNAGTLNLKLENIFLSNNENMLTQRFASLFYFEKKVVLAALQRDITSELEKVETDPQWADHHRYNAFVSQRILSTLNPSQ